MYKSEKYQKINTVFKRDRETKKIIDGDFSEESFDYLQNNVWEWFEKIDGTNMRIFSNGERFCFEGKEDNSSIPSSLLNNLLTKFNQKFHDEVFMKMFPKANACIYSEGVGLGILESIQYTNDPPPGGIIVFDVKVDNFWLEQANVISVAENLGLMYAPNIGQGTLEEAIGCVKSGFKSRFGDFAAEGVVAKPKVQLLNRDGSRVVTKIKYRDFH